MTAGTIKGNTSEQAVLLIPKNTYATQEEALEALETAYNGLTDQAKRNSYLQVGGSKYIYFHNTPLYWMFYFRNNGATFQPIVINLLDHKILRMSITSSGFSFVEEQSNAQTIAYALYVSPY